MSALRVFAWLSAVPYVAIVILVMTGPPTWSAVAYLAGTGLLLVSLMSDRRGLHHARGCDRRDWRGFYRPTPGRAALSIVAIVLVRGCSARSGTSLHDAEARFVNRIVDEQDIALAGTRVLLASGMLQDDSAELTSAMRSAYATMHREEGDAPSPVLGTYLGLQSPSAFDLLMVETKQPVGAVIFLHGYAGNFALPCWQMAKAVAPLGVMTACPSTRWIGDWGSPQGEATVRRTVEMLHARGVRRIVLAGLSNGGYGASQLAPRMRGAFVGLVLISGAESDAPPAGVPTLLVHGRKDTMAGYGEARAYAIRTGAELVTLDAGHFSMLVRAPENDAAVRAFVGRLLAKSVVYTSKECTPAASS